MNEGFVQSRPRRWLRLDGAVLFVASIILFAMTHQSWWVYPVLLFTPDIFMVGYVRSTKVGAFFYNAGHSYFLPSLLVLLGWHHPATLAVGLIWLGHVGFDRMMGYGLKYDSGFKKTHLGDLEKSLPSSK